MINISNCPDTGLKRKILYKDFSFLESTRQVILECHISHFDSNDELIENSRIKSYSRKLVASDSLVNPSNGVLLTEQQIEDYNNQINIGFIPIQEYDYYSIMASNPIVLNTMFSQIIQLRDSQGKFNI